MTDTIVTEVTPDSLGAVVTIEPAAIITGANRQALNRATSILRFIVTQPLGTLTWLLVWRYDQMQDAVARGEP